ncbi:MAG: voltage-gated potassium channel [Thiomicrorhabdus sp.]|nr:MAG: voltage-gated potassium channel [Thiomicrorhabdus sp.]
MLLYRLPKDNITMEQLREIVLCSESKRGRQFDIFIQILIIISLIAFSIETLPDLSPELYRLLRGIEIFVVVVFTIEYILRIVLTDKKLTYIFSFYGLIDLLSILPFYLTTTVSLQALKMLRLLRLLRILKLVRYNQALVRISRAIYLVKEELMLFSIVTLMLLYLSAMGIYHFEHVAQPENFRSIFDSLWWSVVTLTTVGYGDIYPVTDGGRIFTFFMLMLGLGIVAIPTGIIASALSSVRNSEEHEMVCKQADNKSTPE